MPKHVISVGFDVPGNLVESLDFNSNSSLLDADMIIFSPNVSGYRPDFMEPQYGGKTLLTAADSARVRDRSAHWERELRIALDEGKTIFVMLLGVDDLYIYSGQKNYSGTGRNTRVTNMVVGFDPYSSIPISGLTDVIHRRTGERIKTTKDIGILAPYWQEFGPATHYEVYLDKKIGTAALVTQTGDKMVGGIVRFEKVKGP